MVIRSVKKDNEPVIDAKSQLAIEICKIYHNARFIVPCIHIQPRNFATLSRFIDWYLILRVGEDASSETIRKQYYQLALLLHPDKNKHPQAEFAFKLISQAYKYLSDEARRSSFNLERWRNQCKECTRIPQNTHNFSSPPYHPSKNAKRDRNSVRNPTSHNIHQHFKLIREQLKEEIRVIKSCIRINQSPNTEYPVFDPSNYQHLGYPHIRAHHHHFHSKKRFKI